MFRVHPTHRDCAKCGRHYFASRSMGCIYHTYIETYAVGPRKEWSRTEVKRITNAHSNYKWFTKKVECSACLMAPHKDDPRFQFSYGCVHGPASETLLKEYETAQKYMIKYNYTEAKTSHWTATIENFQIEMLSNYRKVHLMELTEGLKNLIRYLKIKTTSVSAARVLVGMHPREAAIMPFTQNVFGNVNEFFKFVEYCLNFGHENNLRKEKNVKTKFNVFTIKKAIEKREKVEYPTEESSLTKSKFLTTFFKFFLLFSTNILEISEKDVLADIVNKIHRIFSRLSNDPFYSDYARSEAMKFYSVFIVMSSNNDRDVYKCIINFSLQYERGEFCSLVVLESYLFSLVILLSSLERQIEKEVVVRISKQVAYLLCLQDFVSLQYVLVPLYTILTEISLKFRYPEEDIFAIFENVPRWTKEGQKALKHLNSHVHDVAIDLHPLKISLYKHKDQFGWSRDSQILTSSSYSSYYRLKFLDLFYAGDLLLFLSSLFETLPNLLFKTDPWPSRSINSSYENNKPTIADKQAEKSREKYLHSLRDAKSNSNSVPMCKIPRKRSKEYTITMDEKMFHKRPTKSHSKTAERRSERTRRRSEFSRSLKFHEKKHHLFMLEEQFSAVRNPVFVQ